MRMEDLQEIHQRRPFVPFMMHLADGRSLAVRHPEFIAYAPHGRTVHYIHPDERFERIDVMLVTSAEEMPEKRRGGRRRKAG